MTTIPFIDLKAQYRRLEADIRGRIDAVLTHGMYVNGPEIAELEAALADFAGCRHAVGCSSGTDALLMALMALDVGPGDAVLTTPFTFIATAEVVALLGATPVFVDVDPGTFNIDPSSLEAAIASLPRRGLTPRAIIPVDLFGLPADYDTINSIAADHGLTVIEDAAQSFGAVYRGRRAPSLAAIGCTSFFPAKPLGCYGDGGAVFTDDDNIADVLRSIRNHGQGADRYDNVRVGINGRLDTMQAAILLPKLAIFQEELDLRGRVARRYTEFLAPLAPRVTLQAIPEDMVSAWAQFSLLVPDSAARDAAQAALKAQGVPTAIYYPRPLHLQPAFARLGHQPGDMPVSEDLAGRIFALPMHPYLEDAQIERIAEAVVEALGSS